MITSFAVDSFWESYATLALNSKKSAKKAYTLWMDNPFHPSLKFKCINVNQNIWSARISHGYRALCIFENSSATWFWIGNHDDYERYFG